MAQVMSKQPLGSVRLASGEVCHSKVVASVDFFRFHGLLTSSKTVTI